MRSRRDLASLGDRHPLARDGLLLHHESDEPPRRPGLLHAAQRLRAREILVESASPAEAGGDRVRVRADVVSVQRVADLEPERVARAQPTWPRASLEHAVPERARLIGHDEQLYPDLARVARAIHHALDALDLPFREGERRRLWQAEAIERPRSLNRDQAVLR